mgnify:CR=1 FL=1
MTGELPKKVELPSGHKFDVPFGLGSRTSIPETQLQSQMTPGHHLGAFLQNFASEYGRKYGGVGFSSAMQEAEAGFHKYSPNEVPTASFIAAEVDRIFKIYKPGDAT